MDPNRLRAEAVVTRIGVLSPRQPSDTDLRVAEELPDRWLRRFRTWLNADQKPATWKDPPEKQEKLQDQILEQLDVDEVTGWLMKDEAVGVELVNVVQGARKYLDAAWPKVTLDGIVPDVLPLSTGDYAEVWSLVRILDDVETTFFDDLEAWDITPTQVKAFATCLPELYAMACQLLQEAVVEQVARKRPLRWQIEDLYKTVMGMPPEAAIKMPELPADTAAPPSKRYDIDFKATRTPAQAQAEREVAR